MNTLDTLCQAISVRQAERMDQGEPGMEEMWVPKATWEAAKRDAEQFMTPFRDPAIKSNTCMGVAIRIIGHDI